MRRALGRLQLFLSVLLLITAAHTAWGRASVTDPQIYASTVAGGELGTANTQFVFRATVHPNGNVPNSSPAVPNSLITIACTDHWDYTTGTPTPVPGNAYAVVRISNGNASDPTSGGLFIAMHQVSSDNFNQDGRAGVYEAVVRGGELGVAANRLSSGWLHWSVYARDSDNPTGNDAGGPNGNMKVVTGTPVVSVDPITNLGTGRLGLLAEPVENSDSGNGGGAHYFTFRARVWTMGAVPPQYMQRRDDITNPFDWRDGAYDNAGKFSTVQNSGVILVVTDPQGQNHYVPMEVDPDNNGGLNHGGLYQAVTGGPNDPFGNTDLLHPVVPDGRLDYLDGGQGIVYRYRMMPTSYRDSDLVPGIGLTYGAPDYPGRLWTQHFVGAIRSAGEIFGRPFGNGFTAFSRVNSTIDFTNPTGANVTQRVGNWTWRVLVNTDLRPLVPADGPNAVTNANQNFTYPRDTYGALKTAYNVQSVTSAPGPASFHVGPLLSDGGWTDDLYENAALQPANLAYPQTPNARPLAPGGALRSRVTTRTKVRFIVRYTTDSTNPGQVVRLWLDGQPHDMQPMDASPLVQGRRYYYDTTFPDPNQSHWYYFDADDGTHRVIWPRRDIAPNGSGDNRFPDPLGQGMAQRGETVLFGTGTVNRNYIGNEPLVNHRPTLSAAAGIPTVSPASGDGSKPFTYTVQYTDADGDEPIVTNVFIDGVAHRMTAVPNGDGSMPNVAAGRTYQFVLNALQATPNNQHTYYFQFQERWIFANDAIAEEGEWVNMPQGDDRGIPTSQLAGPTIITNHAPFLTNAQFVAANLSETPTPASLYDIRVDYHDVDNNAPAYVKVFISKDSGATYDGGTAMVPADTNTSYATGVSYHLPGQIHLAVPATGKQYRFRFEASDGIQPVGTVQVGSGPAAINDGTAHLLRAISGATYGDPVNALNPSTLLWSTSFRVGTGADANSNASWHALSSTDTLNFSDPAGNKNWQPGTVFVWRIPAAGGPPILVGGGSYTVDYANGVVAFVAPVAAGDAIFASYAYSDPTSIRIWSGSSLLSETTNYTADLANGTVTLLAGPSANPVRAAYNYVELVGPAIQQNHVPVLDGLAGGTAADNFLTLRPLAGPPTQQFTFSVRYSDADNQAPRYMNVVIDGTAYAMTAAVPNGTVIDYTQPVTYTYRTTLAAGQHIYHFDVSDGADSTRLPAASAQPSEFSGPNVGYQGALSGATITPTRGTSTDLFVFTVTYTHAGNQPPTTTPEVQITRLADNVVTKVPLNLVPPAGGGAPDYTAGVQYQVQVRAGDPLGPLSAPGAFDGLFEFQGQTAGTVGPVHFVVNTPPTLTSASAGSGSLTRSGNGTFSVKYTDADGDAPAASGPVLRIDGNASTATAVASPANPTGADYQAGVTYTWTIPGSRFTAGAHTYQFTASDGVEAAAPAPSPAGSVTVTEGQSPVLSGAAVTPGSAVQGSVFTYSVVYRHPDGAAPSRIQVFIDPAGATPTGKPMVATPGQTDFAGTGVTYTYTTQANDLAPGPHTFRFEADDAVPHTAYLPDMQGQTKPTIDGPTVNYAGVVSLGSAAVLNSDGSTTPATMPTVDSNRSLSPTVVGTGFDNYRFRVTYTNQSGTAPTYVRLVLDGVSQPVDMTLAPGQANPPAYTTGVTYQVDTPLAVGARTFHFETADALSTGRFPTTGEISGLTVRTAAQFSQLITAPANAQIGQNVTLTGILRTSTPLPADPTNRTITVTFSKPDGSSAQPTGGSAVTVDQTTGAFTATLPATSVDQTGNWSAILNWGGISGSYTSISGSSIFPVTGWVSPQLAAGQWDMVAVPLLPVSPDATLSFGAQGTDASSVQATDLRLVMWDPSTPPGTYLFQSSSPAFRVAAAQAYWLNPGRAVTLNPRGKLWDQTQPYSIQLLPGWNMIGSVYTTDILWSNVQVRYQGQVMSLGNAGALVRPVAWGYNPTANSYQLVQGTDALHTGRGYWIRAFQPCELILNPGTTAVAGARAAIDRSTSMQLVARVAGSSDTDNYIPLVSTGASRTANLEKPPYLGKYVSINFLDGSAANSGAATRAATDGKSIAFEVRTDQKGADVTLQIANMSALGRKYDLTLIDQVTGQRRSLTGTSGYTFNTGDNTAPRQFVLQVDAATYANRLVISGLQAGNSRSTGGRSFSFQLTAPATIRAEILLGGRVVRNITAGRAAATGANQLSWDGRDNQGSYVPAGLYMLRVSGSDASGHAATAVLPVQVVR